MSLSAQGGSGGFSQGPQVQLDHFTSASALAAWQAATIIALLNRIDQLAGEVAANEEFLCSQVDPNTQIDTIDSDDDNDPRERGDLIAEIGYLLTAVVAATSIPNLMLPYDLAEGLSFDSRPNPKFGQSAIADFISGGADLFSDSN